MFKQVLYNTGAQVAGKAITAGTTLLVTVLIGRTLGPAGYGEFTKIFVFVGYFYTLADFGLNAIYIKLTLSTSEANSSPHSDGLKILSILVGLRLILGFLLAFGAISISFFLPYDPQTGIGFSPLVKLGIIIASATIITQALFTTANAYFQKILRYDLSAIAATIGYLVIFVSAVTATFINRSILAYTTAYVAGGITLVTVAYLIIVKRVHELLIPVFSYDQFLDFIKKAWPVGVALLFNLIYFRIDVLILANFRSSVEVGLYGLAYQFFEASLAIPIFFANAIYPLLTKLYNRSLAEFKKQAKNWLKILVLIGVFLAISLFAVAFLIPIIFGKNFSGSVMTLQILALGMPFFFISALLWHLLIIYNKQKYLIYVYGSGAIFNVVANLILIPVFGYLAAAVTTVISEGLIMLLLIGALVIKR